MFVHGNFRLRYRRFLNNIGEGFTLVEITLAIGIFAFAIVAIMALFPIGLQSANESRVGTIVTQIARTVLSDLRTGEFKKARIITEPLPTTGAAPTGTGVVEFDLSANPPTPTYLLYTAGGKIKSVSTSGKYATGHATGDFIVKIESKLVQTTIPVLAQVTVTVEAPASAPATNRTKYPIVTLMGDTR